MSASPEDIAKFTTDGVMIERAYTSIKDLYPTAGDMAAGDEIEMFFDSADDGFAMLVERAALLTMLDRMHEAVEFEESFGLGQGIALTPAVPVFNVVDASRGISGLAAVRSIAFNMGGDRYAVELCGTPGVITPPHDGLTADMTSRTADSTALTADRTD